MEGNVNKNETKMRINNTILKKTKEKGEKRKRKRKIEIQQREE